MKKVFRQGILPPQPRQVHRLILGARIVHFGPDVWGGISFWYEVSTDMYLEEDRTFLRVATGHEVPDSAEYIATCNHDNHTLHLYEEVA